MKKYFRLLGLFLICLLLVTGCGKQDEVAKIIEATNKIDNARFDILISMGMKAEGANLDLDMNADCEFNKDTMYMKMSMAFFGQTFSSESYAVQDGKKLTTYAIDSETNVWTKAEETVGEDQMITNFGKVLTNYKEVTPIEDEKLAAGTKGYKIVISNENLAEVFDLLGTGDETSFTELFNLSGDLVIKVYVNKDYEIQKMFFDFSEVVKSTEEAFEFSKFTMTITIKDVGKVGAINIPAAALNAN